MGYDKVLVASRVCHHGYIRISHIACRMSHNVSGLRGHRMCDVQSCIGLDLVQTPSKAVWCSQRMGFGRAHYRIGQGIHAAKLVSAQPT